MAVTYNDQLITPWQVAVWWLSLVAPFLAAYLMSSPEWWIYGAILMGLTLSWAAFFWLTLFGPLLEESGATIFVAGEGPRLIAVGAAAGTHHPPGSCPMCMAVNVYTMLGAGTARKVKSAHSYLYIRLKRAPLDVVDGHTILRMAHELRVVDPPTPCSQRFRYFAEDCPDLDADCTAVGRLSELAKGVPPHVTDEIRLYDFQRQGVGWMIALYKQRRSGILAHDMGLGKSIQFAATLRLLTTGESLTGRKPRSKEHKPGGGRPARHVVLDSSDDEQSAATGEGPRRVLLLCNASMVASWQKCLESILQAHWQLFHYHSRLRSEELLEMLRTGKRLLIISTYETFRSANSSDLQNLSVDILVGDEAQMFKNRCSLIYGCVKRLQARSKLLLTGTPIMNKYDELWALMSVVEPTVLGDYDSEFVVTFGPLLGPRADPVGTKALRNKLRALVQPHIYREASRTETVSTAMDALSQSPSPALSPKPVPRTPPRCGRKSILLVDDSGEDDDEGRPTPGKLADIDEPLKLPGLINAVVYFDLTEDQRLVYGTKLGQLAPNENLMTRLAQLCSVCNLSDSDTPPKCEFVRVLLRRTRNKYIVFSKYRYVLDQLEKVVLAPDKFTWARLDGTMTPKERERNLAKFREPATRLILITTKAGGTGLTLTEADRVIVLDPSWSAADDAQAIARAHRIGQRHPVIAYRLIYGGTIEDQILGYQLRKTDMVSGILPDVFVKSITTLMGLKGLLSLGSTDTSETVALFDKHLEQTPKLRRLIAKELQSTSTDLLKHLCATRLYALDDLVRSKSQ